MAAGKNPISTLLEICQQWKFPTPTYSESEGNFRLFGTQVSVTIKGVMVQFHATGPTKKESKTNVAQKVLEFIEQDYPQFLNPPLQPVSETALYKSVFYLVGILKLGCARSLHKQNKVSGERIF